jgi:hypothetical protein
MASKKTKGPKHDYQNQLSSHMPWKKNLSFNNNYMILGLEGDSERTWWRLFWTYLMKVILNVPDEGYSERTWWRLFWTYLMKVILNVPDEGYSERTYKNKNKNKKTLFWFGT